MRIPLSRAIPPIRRWRAAPSVPVSAKPEVNTTAALTSRSAHASTASRVTPAGTATMATSISPGTSSMVGRASIPWTRARRGLTGQTAPSNPNVLR